MTISNVLRDDARLLQREEAAEIRPDTGGEQTVFTVPATYTAIEVHVDTRGNPGMVGATVRLYERVAGIEHEAATYVVYADRGPIIRHRGLGTYRITIDCIASALSSAPAYLAYKAWSVDGAAAPFQVSLTSRRKAEWFSTLIDQSTGPCAVGANRNNVGVYLRQFHAVMLTQATAAAKLWVQLWSMNPGGTLPDILPIVDEWLFASPGDEDGFDWRDCHPLAPENDGLYLPQGWGFYLSSTPGHYTPFAATVGDGRMRFEYEARR